VFEHVELSAQMIRNAVTQLRFPVLITDFHLNTPKYIGIGLIPIIANRFVPCMIPERE
jgi:hypothetical protein